MKRRTRLILALDVTELAKAVRVAQSCAGYVDAIKVNYPLVLSAGLDVVRRFGRLADVLCDFKVADVPNTNRLIVDQVVRQGARGVIVHGFVGEDAVGACLLAARGMDVFVVAEMSHPGAARFNAPVADAIARLAVDAGAAGIVAPATRPERLRALRAIVGDRLILAPGVGAQGGTAAEAVRAGADYVIAGRAIYDAPDPAVAAKRLGEEIKAA
jgi:orotidine-5'-phosphate decarboxylase